MTTQNNVTLHGTPLTLVGDSPQTGTAAPEVVLLDNNLKPVRLSDYAGKIVVLSVIPSIDSPVCDMQTRRFNTEATALSEDVVILTVSMDLPFAQKRWCGAAGVNRVITLSDYRTGDFGNAFGLMIKELRLLARAVIVIDKTGVVSYQQLVKEVGDEPDYDAAITAVKKLANG